MLFPEPAVLVRIPRRTAFKLERVAVLGFLALQVGWLGWLLGNSLEHSAHQVAPKVPDSELSAVQDHLEKTFAEIIQRVKLTDCLPILAFCKLYVYGQHGWLDYSATPMSEPKSMSLEK